MQSEFSYILLFSSLQLPSFVPSFLLTSLTPHLPYSPPSYHSLPFHLFSPNHSSSLPTLLPSLPSSLPLFHSSLLIYLTSRITYNASFLHPPFHSPVFATNIYHFPILLFIPTSVHPTALFSTFQFLNTCLP